ncbi:proline--tRNA ligase [Fusobacterium gastrosuis]|uniref:proline--tRNA ligase n=1 Tax=Fusobacterium gastrosuis TaxID=1755100 RepID=UPI00297A5B2C|nr:proline--tRNA ligase [Fusobacteriaceae bacterium]MDD7411003.1 proline--tRNA ligase [Fusobacteriaceae bacterium]MDY5306706.1 proline--tRNA ligase [Fusobacterium gastrosuis]MDY5714071.1 proline--tRNA ligase [Fusobacterium gastrosuis]MDY5795408.1 proline--tRNA ligase [Fusobacterium gastrosuis]
MKFSKSYIKTLKETPKEAEVISHILMLRAGMIKKLASGIYSYLPLGYKALKKVENIVREEMDRAGALEVHMPVIQPAELWQESGRWSVMGPEMFRLKDRHERDFVLGPTHEEVITDIVRSDISSYKALPVNLYQIQTKFRDERRPRFGLMRGREFLMKDAYSFHTSQESLDEEFENMRETYSRIFTRCGLKFRPVEADSGAIGGNGSQEFHVLAESGEDEIIYSDGCDYAANIETATSKLVNPPKEEEKEIELVHTPDSPTIEKLAEFLNIPLTRTVKALLYKDLGTDEFYMVLIRGDFDVNEIKLKNAINAVAVEMATDEEIENLGLIKGYIGPYKLTNDKIKIVADLSVIELSNHVTGAHQKDYHFVNVNYGRDYKADIIKDIRTVKVGETCPKSDGKLHSARGIECGHVFKLGTKYSEALKATYLDKDGKTQTMIMGCYGIGVSRTMAAAIEQNYDENGIIWPVAIAPYVVDIIPANVKNEAQTSLAESIYQKLKAENIDVMLDDRDEKPGFKFKDADLIGFPFKVVVGKRAEEGIVELKIRKTGETLEISKDEVINKIKELMLKY